MYALLPLVEEHENSRLSMGSDVDKLRNFLLAALAGEVPFV